MMLNYNYIVFSTVKGIRMMLKYHNGCAVKSQVFEDVGAIITGCSVHSQVIQMMLELL
jgi:hypothetical protein